MHILDWVIVAVYLGYVIWTGVQMSRRSGDSEAGPRRCWRHWETVEEQVAHGGGFLCGSDNPVLLPRGKC